MQKKSLKSSDNLLEAYFKQIKAFPLLTFEEELELSKKIQEGDKQALHKLINSNLRLVIKIAGLFNVHDISIMDMIQEGNIGLIHAARKFDYRKKVRFCTYAGWWIRQFVSRYISNRRRMVRLPQRKEEELRRIQKAYHLLCQTLMHQPNNADIAKELGIPVHDVEAVINLASDSFSFDQNLNNEEYACTVDFHEDYTYSPERYLMKQLSHDGAMKILNRLKEKEKRVLTYRYQLNGGERYTLREIGDELDISPETVRQIEIRALKKIRLHAEELQECLYYEAM